jgi:hypothetical protein
MWLTDLVCQALEALAATSAEVEAAAQRLGAVDGVRHPAQCLPLIEQLRVCQHAWTVALADLYAAVFAPALPDRQHRLKFHPATLELAPYPGQCAPLSLCVGAGTVGPRLAVWCYCVPGTVLGSDG